MRKQTLFILSTLALLMYPLFLSAQKSFSLSLDVNSAAGDQAVTVNVSPDFDGNGIVDFADFLAFAGLFGSRQGDGRYDARYDLDSDGAIGFSDFLVFSGSFGKEVSSPNVDIPDVNLRAVIADSLGKTSDASITQAEMASLTRLVAPNKNIRDLTGLEFATNLTRLDLGAVFMSGEGFINSNEISNLAPLSGLTSLERLDLDGNSISDITPLAGLTSLERLYLGNNSISDITPLSSLTSLKTLWLSGNSIVDVSALSDLNSLETLSLHGNSISDITPLAGLTSLERLYLSFNNISDITPLSGLTSLESLSLSFNSIVDVSALSGLNSLERLGLDGNSISDLSPLVANAGLGNEDALEVRNNPLSTTSINTHIPALESRGISVSYSRGGGGSGGVDLIVDTPSVSDSTLTAGQIFTLQATVRNQGSSLYDATTLYYYQSDDAIISSSDTRIGSDTVGWLFRSESSSESNNVYAPSRSGTYYYGACVASVSGESNTDNNCSPGVRVMVSGGDGSITYVDIPDANLRAVIADSLGKATDAPISKTEMASLNRLEAPDKNIRDLTGLEFAINLTLLDLGKPFSNSNEISNLLPLSGLTSLEVLDLSFNSISDVMPLSNLNNLRELHLFFNSISDVTPLSNLNNLRELHLSNNSISDVTPLSNLNNLEWLALVSNGISDVTPLSNLNNLRELHIFANNISDVAALSGLTNLEDLDLSFNSISDLTPLSGLTSLEWLDLSYNSISDLTPLSGLTNLYWLGLDDNSISDLAALSDLTSLKTLWLSGNSIVDVAALSGLTNLEDLDLDNNSISDLAPLVANTGLGTGDVVDVRNNPLSTTSINTHIPALQSRGVDVRFGASKPAVKEKERDILRIERWETGDYMYRRQMEERRDVIR